MRYFSFFVVPLIAFHAAQCAVARTRLETCPESLEPVCDSLEPGAEGRPMVGKQVPRDSVENVSAGEVRKICRHICNRFAQLFRTLRDCIRDHAEEAPLVGPVPCSVGRLSACRDARRVLESDWDPARFSAEMRWVCSGDSDRAGWAAVFRANAWASCVSLGNVDHSNPSEEEVEGYLGVLKTMHDRCEGGQLPAAAAAAPALKGILGTFAGLSSFVGDLKLEPDSGRRKPNVSALSRDQTLDAACASLGYFGPTRKDCPIYNCRSLACELFTRNEFPPESASARQFQQRYGCTGPANPTAAVPSVADMPLRLPGAERDPVDEDRISVDMNNF